MQFANLNFDTYRTVTLLKERGYSKKQAEGFIEVMQEVTLSGVATKEDIQDVRNEIQQSRNETLKFQIIQTLTIIGVMIALAKIF